MKRKIKSRKTIKLFKSSFECMRQNLGGWLGGWVLGWAIEVYQGQTLPSLWDTCRGGEGGHKVTVESKLYR